MKRFLLKNHIGLLVATLILNVFFGTQSMQAQTIEQFNYSAGSTALNSKTGGSGLWCTSGATSWFNTNTGLDIASGTLSYTKNSLSLSTLGTTYVTSGTGGQNNFRKINSYLGQGCGNSTYYISFLVRQKLGSNANGYAGVSLFSSNLGTCDSGTSAGAEQVLFGKRNGSANASWGFQIGNSINNGNNSGVAFDTTTRLIVAKISAGSGSNWSIRMWVDPPQNGTLTDGSISGAAGYCEYLNATLTGSTCFDKFRIEAGGGSGIDIDEFRFSTSYTDVIPAAAPATPTIAITSGSNPVCSGSSVTFTATAGSGSGTTPAYQWLKNGNTISGATSSTYTATADAVFVNNDQISCRVTQNVGTSGLTPQSATSAATTMTVTSPPNAGTLSGDQIICVSGMTVFSTNGTPGGSWSSSDAGKATVDSFGVVTGITAGTPTITYTLNGTGGCANATATRNVTVIALPPAGITNNTGTTVLTCAVTSISVTATGGIAYSWSDGSSVVGTSDNLSITAPGSYTVTVTNSNGCNATATIVITQNIAATSSSQTVTACDTYTWSVNEQTYTTSGTYTNVGTNAAGCADTKTLVLTINSSTSSSQTVTTCDTYTWSENGQTYTTSGPYTSTSINAAGCTDTKTLVLTINHSTASSETVSACDTYTWPVDGNTYTASGTYTYTSTNAAGCTDTKTLVLTVYVSTPSSQTITACDSYLWSVDGHTYSTSGTYVFEGTNAAGCSQNQTLYLTINTSTASTQTVTACDSYAWSVNGGTYTESGTYTSVGANAAGCTDTKTLVLTINNSTASSQAVSACDTYTWSVNGNAYTESGTYTFVGTNAAGCTDTKTLLLTITPSTTHTTTVSVCDTYTWSAGNNQTYTESGEYTFVNGCHTETLALTITPSTSNTTTATACDSYTWSVNGQTYTTSGIYNAVTGCHTEVLNLTINNNTSSSQTITACDTYTWSVNGQPYTASGTYTYVGTNASGCTDTKTLNLTINNSTSSSQTVSACGSYTWLVNGQTYTTSGIYIATSTNAAGCTDTKTLNLTVSGINKSNATATWSNGQNDSTTGFGAWNFTTNGTTAGFFSGSSDVNNGGSYSWGMYAAGGTNVASATRPVTMGVGNTVSFSMDNGFIDTGKTIGFGLQNSTGQNLAELVFIGGQATYRIIDSVSTSTSVEYTGSGLDISLTYTGLNTYAITITPKSGSAATYTGRTFLTETGGQKPAQVRFFNAGAGSGGSFDLYFNSLAINNPVITTQPSVTQQNICAGSTPINLTVSASGSGKIYQWYSSTSNISYTGATNLGTVSGANTATLTPQNTDAGTLYYYCVVTDPCGATYSNFSGAVVVTSPLNAGTLSGTQEVCVNGLTAFSTNGTTGGSWSSSASGVASVNASGTVTGVSAGSATITYTLNGTGGCPTATAARTITVNPLPTAGITNNTGSSVITCSTTAISVTATGGDSYSWFDGADIIGTSADLEITAGGTYTVTVTNAFGCIATTSITITEDKTTVSSETATACDTYTWSLNGQTYTASGNYTYVSTNEAGCVNTATLHLTINNSTAFSQTVSVCDSYAWSVNGEIYTASGTYTSVSTNAAGCTDTKTLVLTITPSTAHTTVVSACDTFTWTAGNGDTYTESGSYTYVTGCHTETLALTITPSTAHTTTVSACDTFTWTAGNGDTYTESGSYTYITGCHTETLVLTITSCSSEVTVTMNIEGYYDVATHSMRAAKFNQEAPGYGATDVDDVTVELRDTTTFALVATATAKLQTNGTVVCTYGTAPSGSFYLAVKHRNALETWSATPITVGPTPASYNFTNAVNANMAYGSNMVLLESGVYGFYSGDLDHNGTIETADGDQLLNDAYNTVFGDNATDLDGNGTVEVSDTDYFLNNAYNTVYSVTPQP